MPILIKDMCKSCMCQALQVNDFTKTVRLLWDTGRADWWGESGQYMINTHPVMKTTLCYYHTKEEKGVFK